MSREMRGVELEELSAFLDGALDASREEELRRLLEDSPELAAQLAELRGVDEALRQLPAPAVPGGLHARLRARIDSEAGVETRPRVRSAPAAAAPHRTPGRRRRFGGPGALAAGAALAAAVLALLLVPRLPDSGRPAPGLDGTQEAEGSLAAGGLSEGGLAEGLVEEPLLEVMEDSLAMAELVDEAGPEIAEDWTTIEVLGLLESLEIEEASESG